MKKQINLSNQQSNIFIHSIKHHHLVSSPQFIYQIASIPNSKHPLQKSLKKLKTTQLNTNIIKSIQSTQSHSYSRNYYQEIQSKIKFLLSTIQKNNHFHLSQILEYKQNVFTLFLQDFIKQTYKQCKQKGQTLSFICFSLFQLIKSITKKLTIEANNQNKQNIMNLVQTHQNYQKFIQSNLKNQKQTFLKNMQYQKTIDGLVYNLRFKRKQIKKLRAGVSTCTKKLNELKTSYLDLQNEHIELIMATKQMSKENAQFLTNRKMQINKAKFQQLKLKQNSKKIKQKIRKQLIKDTCSQVQNLKKQLKLSFNDPNLKSIKHIMLDAAFDQFDVQTNMVEVMKEMDLININSGLAYIDQGTDMLDFINCQLQENSSQTRYFDMLINRLIDNQEIQVNISPQTNSIKTNAQTQTQHSFFIKNLRRTLTPVFQFSTLYSNKMRISKRQSIKVSYSRQDNNHSNSRNSLISSKKGTNIELSPQINQILEEQQQNISICNSIQELDEINFNKISFKKIKTKKNKQQSFMLRLNSPSTPKTTITRKIITTRGNRGSKFFNVGQFGNQTGRSIRSSVRASGAMKQNLKFKQGNSIRESSKFSKRGSSLISQQFDRFLEDQPVMLVKKSKFGDRCSLTSSSSEDLQKQSQKWQKIGPSINNIMTSGTVTKTHQFLFGSSTKHNYDKNISNQLIDKFVKTPKSVKQYNQLLYKRVKSFISNFQLQLMNYNKNKRRVSCQISSKKINHKIIGQVYFKAYQYLSKGMLLTNLLSPLLSTIQLNYGGIKKQDLLDKSKFFISQTLFNSNDIAMQSFYFLMGINFSQLSSKVTVLDLHFFIHLMENLNIQIPLSNMVNKISQFYTTYAKVKQNLRKALQIVGINIQFNKKFLKSMEEKYFSNFSNYLTKKPQQKQNQNNDIDKNHLNLFKVCRFFVEQIIKQKQLYIQKYNFLINLFNIIIDRKKNDNFYLQRKKNKSNTSRSQIKNKQVNMNFIRMLIRFHLQSQINAYKKIKIANQMFSFEIQKQYQYYTLDEFAHLCLRINLLSLQNCLQQFLLMYKIIPTNFLKISQREYEQKPIINLNNNRQEYILMSQISSELKSTKKKKDNQIQIDIINKLLDFQFIEEKVNIVLQEILSQQLLNLFNKSTEILALHQFILEQKTFQDFKKE